MHAIGMLLLAAAEPLPDLVDAAALDQRFLIDIKYATTDNFTGKKIYPEARCLMRKSVGEKMVAAQRWLDQHHAGLRLMFKDCYRPHSVQLVMWEAVKGTPKARYVANPHTALGSIHSYGAAVDLTLAGADGRELDMGTPYDHLGELAEPRHEEKFLAEGKLTKAQVRDRRILRRAMRESGMRGLLHEWWHFNEYPPDQIRNKYQRLDVPFSAFARKE
jgi:zinc D-Ala-D-Ala dipeptidase